MQVPAGYILVTGGAGYIGSHMLLQLADAGYRVVTLDNLTRGSRLAVQNGEVVVADLLDLPAVTDVFRRFPIAAVMHFAALAYVGESVQEPEPYYRNNVIGTLNLLSAMRQAGVKRLVFSSTCATFGEPLVPAIDETQPQQPINPYGWTKRMIEQILADYERSYGLKSIILRYFNVAGADPQGRVGERHDPETHLIPLVLQASLGIRDSITVLGRDYETPDGTCIRDYIHVHDLCTAHLLALNQLLETGTSRAYHLGNEQGYSVQEVIATVERVTGRTVKVIDGARRPGDPARLVADSTRARTELGWSPKYAALETIISHAWEWERKKHVPTSE